MRVAVAVVLLACLGLAGCVKAPPSAPDLAGLPHLAVTSSAFAEGGKIPARHTCTDADLSPPLSIAGAPAEARFFAGLLEDPDATRGTWTHWTWWDVPADVTDLAEDADVAGLGGHEGLTTGKTVGYAGPCPRVGEHHYHLRVYALAQPLGLGEGASVAAVHAALEEHAIAQGELVGLYAKPSA